MRRVTVWREEVLPASETFIVNQLRAMRSWTPLLAGVRTRQSALAAVPEFVVEDGSTSLAGRANRWLYWRLGTSPRLQRRLAATRLVHAHFGPDGARIARAARLARRPLLVTYHGYDATMPSSQLGIDYRPLFRAAAGLICVSEFVRGRLVAAGAPEDKTSVLPIGIPIPPDAGAERAPRVLFVGRLVEKKGCADLLEALSGLPDPPSVDVIGEGPLRADLERLADDLRVPARFLGSRDPEYVARAMSSSLLLCVPCKAAASGDQDGLPMVFLEAAAHRLPVVSYASGGVPEGVADGETGLLAPEGDVVALARSLQAVVRDPELAGRLGSAGRARVEAMFDINRCTARLERLYDETVMRPAAA
ncbi:MAG TPA: glycosyltransferase [Solirubrobacteraceae bacterium]|nr:glycosyltransferase [Solirubrobacteraceae bacterium]